MSAVCPVCNKDDAIQKVSAVVSSGTSSGSFSGPTGGMTYSGGKLGGFGGYTSLSGVSASELAQRLKPPPKPVLGSRSAGCLPGLVSWLLLGFAFYVAHVSIVAAIVFGAGSVAFGLVTQHVIKEEKVKLNKEFEAGLADWERVHSFWSRFYYCFRDDVVFDPVTGDHAPAPESGELLRRAVEASA